MIKSENLIRILVEHVGAKPFFTGVPDSLLKYFLFALEKSNELIDRNVIAVNEGSALSIATGYHLATRKTPIVYLQNSGLGNIVNPASSLINEEVNDIPIIFLIGYRGAPGINDEPQHKLMGSVTESLLRLLNIEYLTVDHDTELNEIKYFLSNKSCPRKALLFLPNSLQEEKSLVRESTGIKRKDAIAQITGYFKDGLYIATTGKTGRELFTIRNEMGKETSNDFLNAGAMGHATSIALGLSLGQPTKRVVLLDGDGAFLMHLGSSVMLSEIKPKNLVHILFDNNAHESVGGFKTSIERLSLLNIAKGLSYPKIYFADSESKLKGILNLVFDNNELTLIIVKTLNYSEKNLGRPQKSFIEMKNEFMAEIKK